MKRFELKELLPLVTRLMEKYTSKESTSISYEKAEQLMGAVVYCIEETKQNSYKFNLPEKNQTARQAYDTGYVLVKEKAEKAEELYNEMLLNFCDYGNRCYHDTFVKGMPQFFLYYDSLYNPQNHILTLDYPVVGNVEKLCGIDLIYQYLMCIEIENELLAGFEEDRIREILLNYHNNYEELIINVSEIILRHILLEGIQRIEGEQCSLPEAVKEFVELAEKEKIENQILFLLKQVVKNYEHSEKLFFYLVPNVKELAFEIEYAIKSDNWNRLSVYNRKKKSGIRNHLMHNMVVLS